MKKLISILVAFAMMATLCVLSAFAADPDPADPEDAKLVKYLEMPEGVSVPNATFTFTFEDNLTASSNVDAEELATANPGTQVISFADGYSATDTDADAASVYKADDLKALGTFTHAGVYAYTVTETDWAFDPADTNKTIVPDGKSYIVRYVVKNVDGQPAVTDITVQEVGGNKVDATTEDPTENDKEETTTVEYDGFTFKNTYQKTEGDGTLDKAPLKVSKAVAGEAGAPAADFPFSITLTQAYGAPATAPTAQVYEGTTPVGEPISVPYGTAKDFTLKAGQTLAFLTLPAGTSYAVSENLTGEEDFAAFAPSYAVNTTEATGSADYGVDLATSTLRVNEADKDLVAYTNTYDKDIDTPTGILMNNLPYIVLALVAIGGLVAYVIVRRRQSDEA